MIRPSQLQIAQYCGLAPILAAQYPESSSAAQRGTAIHEEIAAHVNHGKKPTLPAVKRLLATWTPPAGIRVETKVELRDPESGSVITEGTVDAHWSEDATLIVTDWKSGRPEYVTRATDNLQVAAYACALAITLGAESYEPRICFLSDEAAPLWDIGDRVSGADMWAVLGRLKAAASKPPEAVVGPHCDNCWQRKHCPAWLLPAHAGPTELEPFTQPGGLTSANATRALAAIQAMKKAVEVAEAHLKDYARENTISDGNGKVWGPSRRAGRKSADVKQLEADGLSKYVRDGAPYEVFSWRRIG